MVDKKAARSRVKVAGVHIPKPTYVPDRGDIIYVDFDPQVGREIQKRRPALVITDRKYNKATQCCLVCPITNTIRKTYPFSVELRPENKTTGDVLCDQIKHIDWTARKIEFVEHMHKICFQDVMTLIRTLID